VALWNVHRKKTLRDKSKMANDAQIFNIRALISFERLKLETSNLVCTSTTSSFDRMQKLGQRGRGLFSVTYILNLRTPVNISRTAKATEFKFIVLIECKEWKMSSKKLGQNLGHNDLLLGFSISSVSFSILYFCIDYSYRLQVWCAHDLGEWSTIGSTINECRTGSMGLKTRSRVYILSLRIVINNS